MNTKFPLLYVVSAGSQDIRLLPRKMVLESEFGDIRDMSRLTQKSEIQYPCAFTRFEKNPEKPKRGAECRNYDMSSEEFSTKAMTGI